MSRLDYNEKKRLSKELYESGYRPTDHATSFGEKEGLLENYYNNEFTEDFGEKRQLSEDDYYDLEREIEEYEREQRIRNRVSHGGNDGDDNLITGILGAILAAVILFFVSSARWYFLPSLLVARLGLVSFGILSGEQSQWLLAIVIAMLLSVVIGLIRKRMPATVIKINREQGFKIIGILMAVYFIINLMGNIANKAVLEDLFLPNLLLFTLPLFIYSLLALFKSKYFKFSMIVEVTMYTVMMLMYHFWPLPWIVWIIINILAFLMLSNKLKVKFDWLYLFILQIAMFISLNGYISSIGVERIDVSFVKNLITEFIALITYYFIYKTARCPENVPSGHNGGVKV